LLFGEPRAETRRDRLEDPDRSSHASPDQPLLGRGLPAAQRGDDALGALQAAA
jgi:hypothetical protein